MIGGHPGPRPHRGRARAAASRGRSWRITRCWRSLTRLAALALLAVACGSTAAPVVSEHPFADARLACCRCL